VFGGIKFSDTSIKQILLNEESQEVMPPNVY